MLGKGTVKKLLGTRPAALLASHPRIAVTLVLLTLLVAVQGGAAAGDFGDLPFGVETTSDEATKKGP